MKKRKSDEKGFTLIEVIVTLVLVGITAVLAGMWIVSVANGYFFAKMNASTTQKAQLAMTRLTKEFAAIQSVTDASATSITYTRSVDSDLGTTASYTVSQTGTGPLLLAGNILTDSVSSFALSYCDNIPTSGTQTCGASWSSTSRTIIITLTLTAGNNTPVTFTQRVTPRNL